MLERKGHALASLGGDEMQRHAQEGVDRNLDRHGNAAHRTAQHDALAIELDPSHPLVRRGAARGGWTGQPWPRRTAVDASRSAPCGPSLCARALSASMPRGRRNPLKK